MCQFGTLWRSFTCGYLDKLLEPGISHVKPAPNDSHAPSQAPANAAANNSYLEQYFIFIGVAYWKQVPQLAPKIFDNPAAGDALTFAEVHLFLPSPRLIWEQSGSSGGSPQPTPIGGVPGDFSDLPAAGSGGSAPGGGGGQWIVGREGVPATWDLLTQRWTCQLAPAAQPALVAILQTVPNVPTFNGDSFTPPDLGNLGPNDIGRINAH